MLSAQIRRNGDQRRQKLKQLEDENRRLKQLVGELTLDNQGAEMDCRKKLVTPALKREWAQKTEDQFHMSERRVCRLLTVNRETVRHVEKVDERNQEIQLRLKELAGQWKRFGYRRLHILLQRQGLAVNHKRVYRLYKDAGLSIRSKRKRLPAQQRASRSLQDSIPIRDGRWTLCLIG